MTGREAPARPLPQSGGCWRRQADGSLRRDDAGAGPETTPAAPRRAARSGRVAAPVQAPLQTPVKEP